MKRRREIWPWILAGVLIAPVLFKRRRIDTAAACALPRGIRNNNPGNIRFTSVPWRGKVAWPDNTDIDCTTGQIVKAFEQFTSPLYGVRAMIKQIMTYMNRMLQA